MKPFRQYAGPVWANPFLLFAIYGVAIATLFASSVSFAHGWQTLYQTNWLDGLDPRFGVQANAGDLAIVADSAGRFERALHAKIAISENFTHVANGVPRAELLFPPPVRFAQGNTYRVSWSTMLPPGTRFDEQQFVIFTQVNQGLWLGGPTVALALQGSRYAISQKGGIDRDKVSAGKWLCCAKEDIGKWVFWELIYHPQEQGANALTELWRDGRQVFVARSVPNAYPNVMDAYLKIGLYKPNWKLKSTDVTQVSMLYGPVTISVLRK